MQNELELTPKNESNIQIVETLKSHEITGSKAQMIEQAFAPMIVMLKNFEAEYEAVMAK